MSSDDEEFFLGFGDIGAKYGNARRAFPTNWYDTLARGM